MSGTYDSTRLHPSQWRTEPFPHAVIDGLWDDDLLEAARREFFYISPSQWRTYGDPEEYGKRAIDDSALWGSAVRTFFNIAGDPLFRADLEVMTGISDIDPHEAGGGLHETGENGRLGMHRDFNYNPLDGRPRRLNLLTYLNHDWDCAWGGCLYLGADRSITVTPIFNRTVLFECGPESWHGHPDPIVGEHLRRSLATYYYTPPGSVDLGDGHSTIYRRD